LTTERDYLDAIADALPWDHLRELSPDTQCYTCLLHHIANEHCTPQEWYSNPGALRFAFPEHSDLHILHIGYHAKVELGVTSS
jgi:hypothetical protein